LFNQYSHKMKKLTSIIISIILSSLILLPSYAAATETPVAEKTSVMRLQERGTCYRGALSGQLEAIAAGTKIVTEIEEGVSKPGDIGGATVVNCFRVTACKKDGDKKTLCVSKLNTECTPKLTGGQEDFTYKEYDKTTGKNVEKPGKATSDTTCEKVQIIVSDAGMGLLYAYIGMVYKWAASIVGVVAILIIVIGGIQISAAGGDPSAVDEAKGRIFKAISGLALLFLSGLLLNFINPTFFKG
jgi:hypothetical protein